MSTERIVSFLPSATELLYELGVQDKLYGVTHECLYPEGAKKKPRVINSVFEPSSMSSKEIDHTNSELLREGKDVFVLNEKNLKEANPDLIITQNTCEVCAAHTNQVNQAFEILNKKPRLHLMDPHNLSEILDTVTELAKIIGKEREGRQLRHLLEKRISFVKSQQHDNWPKVLAIEWIEPFFTSGHWIPEMIKVAGGHNVISKTGEHSRKMTLEEIAESDADIVIFMPCGFDTARTIAEYKIILQPDEKWNKLRAVRDQKIYAVDANSYFSKPSIRTIKGIEILAKIIHPEIFEKISVPKNSFAQIRT